MRFLSFLRTIFRHESWESRLYTPTMIQKIDDTYFGKPTEYDEKRKRINPVLR